jgi:hypothetical protein
MKRDIKIKEVSFDVVVVGGGMSGICAAISASRHGAKTALVHARPVFGGNASSEIRMHICGASANMAKPMLEESGILYELMLENKAYNDYFNYSIWDMILYKKVKEQKNLTFYLNTVMDDCQISDNTIQSITAYQQTTETRYKINGKIFVDATGNATLGYLAGAQYKIGSEGKDEFNEPHAPSVANNNRMGNTLLFKAVDRGTSINFKRPDFAFSFTEEQLKYRTHGKISEQTKKELSEEEIWITSVGSSAIDTGYWWVELCGKTNDIIDEYEEIRDELVSCIYGVWDHMKNGGNHGAENYDLQWVGMLPGTRESRRLVGDYMLNENDVLENRQFYDAVAYGGWPMDIHTKNGLYDFDKHPTELFSFDGAYTIPYRSYYSKNITNLMMAGRNISASKMAMGSTRVMGTCALGGQAVGTAAAMCITMNCPPRDILNHIHELQQVLLKDDCYIPNLSNCDKADKAKSAKIKVSSERELFEAKNVVSGVTRPTDNSPNMWVSNGISEEGETLSFDLNGADEISQVILIFDTNFNYSIKQTQNSKRQNQQRIGVPPELVKNYIIKLWKDNTVVFEKSVCDNHQRLNVIDFPSVNCDKVTITVTETNGCGDAHIYEVRIY